MSDIFPCPKCNYEYTYPNGTKQFCPDCSYEWELQSIEQHEAPNQVMDSNGNPLKSGDSVVIIKDLPVKGAPKSIKSGTKVKNIRVVDAFDGHNINCKIDGFGSMVLKSEFVRKA